MSQPFFNYIITIHNKEDLILDVLVAVSLCCGPSSTIFPVLDGCTDNSEAIVDEFIAKHPNVRVVKVYAPNVHELLSINIGLRAAPQEGEGYNIILQDDVILEDASLETKIQKLYEWGKGRLGYVSFRLGANIASDALTSSSPIPLTNEVENAYGQGAPHAKVLLPGRLAYCTVPIKSPVCLPTKIVREVGMMDEDLAPYGHDDTDLAIRIVAAGYFNAVFAIRFHSDIKWGGTRTKPHPEISKIIARNMNKIREKHGPNLQRIAESPQRNDVIIFPEMCSIELDSQAITRYKAARRQHPESSLQSRIRRGMRRIVGA